MTATAQKHSLLKGLSERQLAVLQVILKYDLKLDISDSTRFSFRNNSRTPLSTQFVFPPDIDRPTAATELERALVKRAWSSSSHARNQVGTALLRKGLLVEVAEVRPETDKGGVYGGSTPRVARYALSNAAREAAGGIAVALADLRSQEEAAVAREKAWDVAMRPFQFEYKGLRDRIWAICRDLSTFVKEETPEKLVEAHRQYHEIMVELFDLNRRLLDEARRHDRKQVTPFDLS